MIFAHITRSAAAVCGVAFYASVAKRIKKATEQTVRLARIVMCIVDATHPSNTPALETLEYLHI